MDFNARDVRKLMKAALKKVKPVDGLHKLSSHLLASQVRGLGRGNSVAVLVLGSAAYSAVTDAGWSQNMFMPQPLEIAKHGVMGSFRARFALNHPTPVFVFSDHSRIQKGRESLMDGNLVMGIEISVQDGEMVVGKVNGCFAIIEEAKQ